MSALVRIVAAIAGGYSLGMIPSASLAARLAGREPAAVRQEGTGNPGGLNASHVLGPKWGAAVALADVAKGVAATSAGRRVAGERGANLAATTAVLGHCYPMGRPGGKGVATSVGQVIGTFPVYLPIDVGVALSTAALPWFRRRTEVATKVASVAWVGCGLVWWSEGWSVGRGRVASSAVPIAAAVSSVVVHSRFRADSHRVDEFNRKDAGTP